MATFNEFYQKKYGKTEEVKVTKPAKKAATRKPSKAKTKDNEESK